MPAMLPHCVPLVISVLERAYFLAFHAAPGSARQRRSEATAMAAMSPRPTTVPFLRIAMMFVSLP